MQAYILHSDHKNWSRNLLHHFYVCSVGFQVKWISSSLMNFGQPSVSEQAGNYSAFIAQY